MKWKKGMMIALVCLFFGSSFSQSYGAEGDLKRYDPINKTCRTLGFESYWYGKGRRLFDQKCKTCHTRNNSHNAPFLYSESKSSKGWSRVFFKKYPKCAKSGAWKITAEESLFINDYLFRYSANTHNPNQAS